MPARPSSNARWWKRISRKWPPPASSCSVKSASAVSRTALPHDQIRCICEGCKRGLELVHNGNERSALFALRTAREMGDLHRVILGTDAPAGSGVQPLGILRMVSMLSSLGDLPAELAFCLATGNTARMRELDCGLIEVGRSADFVIMDKA